MEGKRKHKKEQKHNVNEEKEKHQEKETHQETNVLCFFHIHKCFFVILHNMVLLDMSSPGTRVNEYLQLGVIITLGGQLID